ncbi:MAG: GspH/FimT family pseudopilin [Gammaproteobacteria bacterium]|nr:GspH/FimT family pseudopilin [Gammaproteobacteria bacterium]
MSYQNRQRGFTLGEVMATLAIAAITATLAVPAMQSLVTNGEQSAQDNDLISALHTARNTAITRNIQVTICPSANQENCDGSDWEAGWIFFVDDDRDRQVDQEDEILGSTPGIAGVDMISAEFEDFFAFRSNGQIMVNSIAENSGEFLICDQRGDEYNRSLILHVGGKPQLGTNPGENAYDACQ